MTTAPHASAAEDPGPGTGGRRPSLEGAPGADGQGGRRRRQSGADPADPGRSTRAARTVMVPIALLALVLVGLGMLAAPVPGWSGALFTADASSEPASISTAADWVDPVASSAVIAVDGGALPAGTVYQSTTFRVYASVTDDGGVPSGVATVTADVSAVSTGATAVALTAGTWVVDGISHGWRSAPVTADAGLTPGTAAWSLTSTDAAGNAGTQPFSVIVDTTGPTFSGSVIAPVGSSTPGFIREAGAYRVYALVSDPVAAITTVAADVTALTAGGTAVALTSAGGPWVVDGVSYSHRSASVTAEASLAAGAKSYTLTAVDALDNTGSGTGSVTVDNTAPVIISLAPRPEAGAVAPGFVGPGVAYRVYANAADAPAGIATMTADVSSISSGQSAATMTLAGGPWTVNGTSYAWRSAVLTADAALAAGAKAWSTTAIDLATNSASLGSTATVDGTAPSIGGVAIARVTGSTPGYLSTSTDYRLYANAADTGSGIGQVVADASSLTPGQTAVSLTTAGGPWVVDAISYGYRSESLTSAASLTDGAHTIPFTAWDNGGGSAMGSASVTVDGTAPSVVAAAIIRTTGVAPGFIKRGTTYYIHATVTDATGLTTVTANVTTVTSGATAVTLSTSGGPFTVDGVTYTHRSASRTASNSITDGTVPWSVTATDVAANVTTSLLTVVVDNTAPVRVAAAIVPTVGATTGGFIRQGGTYHVYATVTDAGSGVATVRANTTNLTTGASATTMTTSGGPWTIGGVTYAYRSASLTANAVLSAGSKTYRITAVDALGTSGNTIFSVIVDNTAPGGTASAIAKVTGLVGILSSGSTYHVYANASDAAGIAALTANVSLVTAGATAAPLSTDGGPWIVGGTSFAWRSAPMVADASLVNGLAIYVLSVRDNASNIAIPSFTLTIDNASGALVPGTERVEVSLVATAGRGAIGRLTPGRRVRLAVRVTGPVRVRRVTIDASAIADGAAATHLGTRMGGVTTGRSVSRWRTAPILIAARGAGRLPVVVRLKLAGGRVLVTTIPIVVRSTDSAGPDPSPAPGPTASPEPSPAPDPSPAPGPTASPDPGRTATPLPSREPAPSPVPVPTARPEPDPTVTPSPSQPPPPTPKPEPDPTLRPDPTATPTPEPDPTASPEPERRPDPTPAPEPDQTPFSSHEAVQTDAAGREVPTVRPVRVTRPVGPSVPSPRPRP